MSPLLPVCGLADLEARLIEADPALAELHARSGGSPGGQILIPQLAALVRVVARLEVPAFRYVSAADDGVEIDIAVHALPRDGHVRIEIGAWDVRPAERLAPVISVGQDTTPSGNRPRDSRPEGTSLSFLLNARLEIVLPSAALEKRLGLAAGELAGRSLTRCFDLTGGGGVLLEAFARQTAFTGQWAALAGHGDAPFILSGLPQFDRLGHFSGYHVRGMRVEDGSPATSVEALPTREGGGFPRSIETGLGADVGTMLRSPLGKIIADAGFLRDRTGGSLRQCYADYAVDIEMAARHLLSLVDDLVELQAIEHPAFRIEVEPVDLCAVARRVAGLLGGQADEKEVEIDVDCPLGLTVLAEERRVIQILVNLIGNAVRHAPRGSRIRLAGRTGLGIAVLAVEDEGPGVPPADRARIFEKFVRLDRVDPAGSGLGLYISRRLARAMQGEVDVEDGPTGGACFTLALPLSVDQRLSTGT